MAERAEFAETRRDRRVSEIAPVDTTSAPAKNNRAIIYADK